MSNASQRLLVIFCACLALFGASSSRTSQAQSAPQKFTLTAVNFTGLAQ